MIIKIIISSHIYIIDYSIYKKVKGKEYESNNVFLILQFFFNKLN